MATRKSKHKKQRSTTRKRSTSSQTKRSTTSAETHEEIAPQWSWYDPDAPLLSMAMMVKNEEEFLEEALMSVKGLVDELVVVDTGSSDRTVEIARQHGAKIYHYMWRDDFSDARNETIRRCTGNWVLILDADERLQMNPDKIAYFRKGLENYIKEGPYIGISIDVVNTRLDGSLMNSLPSLRFFPRCEEICYRNRVHNQIALKDDNVEMQLKQCDFIKIQHLGYDPTVYEKRKKSARSLPLIQKMLLDEPDNMVYKFYEGREYVILKQHEQAVKSLESAVLGILEGKMGYFSETMKTLLTAYEQTNTSSERIILFTDMAIEKSPEQPDFYLFKGFAEVNLNLTSEAIKSLQESIERWNNFKLTEVSQSHPIIEQRLWAAHYMLGRLLWDQDDFQGSYHHYLKTIKVGGLPPMHQDWRKLLNNLAALAIEFNDTEHLEGIFRQLLIRQDTQLDMFFFRLDQLISQGELEDARVLLTWGAGISSRLKRAPEYQGYLSQLTEA